MIENSNIKEIDEIEHVYDKLYTIMPKFGIQHLFEQLQSCVIDLNDQCNLSLMKCLNKRQWPQNVIIGMSNTTIRFECNVLLLCLYVCHLLVFVV